MTYDDLLDELIVSSGARYSYDSVRDTSWKKNAAREQMRLTMELNALIPIMQIEFEDLPKHINDADPNMRTAVQLRLKYGI